MSSLPLRYRLPNPPAIFVGRETEVDWLADSIKNTPVTVVWGPGGLGKTALILQVLHRRFKRRLDHILLVRLSPDLGGDELRQEILRALAEAEEVGSVDWASLQGDPDAMTESLLDLAERGKWWVVLDDVHHAPPEEMQQLMQQLASYARNSRWIGTSRMDPGLADTARVLKLAVLDEPELMDLARAWGRADDAVGRAVTMSGGSPWLLQQCLATGRAEASLTRESLFADLPQEAAEWLDAVSVLDVTLPADTIECFAPALSAELLASMERRGLVEPTAAGLRLHDVVRSVLRAPGSAPAARDWAARVAPVLADDGSPAAQLEALRLAAELDDMELLARVLDRHGEALLGAGYAPRLWRFLEPLTDERVSGWRLRCAAQLGNPTALSKVQEPARPDFADRITWAHTLFAQGQLLEAEEVASAVASSSQVDETLRAEAVLLGARSLGVRGETDAALERLRGISDLGGDLQARRDAEIALCLLSCGAARSRASERDSGEGDEALRLADALRARLGGLSGQAQQEVSWAAAFVYRARGRLTDAAELLRAAQSSPQGDAPALLAARRVLWLGARVDIDRGDLDGAEEKLELLAPFTRSASLVRPHIVMAQAVLDCARGHFDGLEQRVSDVAREASLFGLHQARLEAEALRVYLGALLGDPDRSDEPGGRSPDAERLRLRRREHALRGGEAIGEQESKRLSQLADGELGLLAASVRGRDAVVRGVADEAIEILSAGVQAAAASGHVLGEVELRDTLCEALLVLGRADEAAVESERLRSVATRVGATRFEHAADFYATAASERPRCAALERLAGSSSEPVAARRARLLLGARSEHDTADLMVVEAVRARTGWTPPAEVVASGGDPRGWQPGWGLDVPARRVWLPDGCEVDFAKRALHWRVLEVIAGRGGAATKEQLVHEAWEEADYHPLRHDPRLQVAIRKLRELLEEDPSSPVRLITLEDGYGFSGPVRRLAD